MYRLNLFQHLLGLGCLLSAKIKVYKAVVYGRFFRIHLKKFLINLYCLCNLVVLDVKLPQCLPVPEILRIQFNSLFQVQFSRRGIITFNGNVCQVIVRGIIVGADCSQFLQMLPGLAVISAVVLLEPVEQQGCCRAVDFLLLSVTRRGDKHCSCNEKGSADE